MLPSLSLVVLMYNEEANIVAVLGDMVAYAEQALDDWEIVVVDDGSTDRSAALVRAVSDADPRVRLVQHGRNRGMGAGMATGIGASEKALFVFFPADGQVAPTELDKMLPLVGQGDIVLSTYGNDRELVRRLISDGLRVFMRVAVGIRFELQGLYLFPTALARTLVDRIGAETFFFSFELIHRAIEAGASVATTEIYCLPRAAGESKVFNLPRIKRVGTEVLRYAWRRRTRT